MKKIINNLKYINTMDLLAPFIFILILPFSLVFRFVNKICGRKLWLICESGNTARDNGYYFFKYVRQNYPDDYCFYVIDKKSDDYSKVKDYGNVIQFKSLKHWLYYLSAKYNISSQKNGNPNQPFFYFLHVSLGLYKNRVFLQHGITKDDAEWLYYKNTKFKHFICGAKREYDFIKEKFGYPADNVNYTGFARFDNLHNINVNENQILVMPTWRNWLGRNVNKLGRVQDFEKTIFFKNWNRFLNDPDLIDYIEKNNIIIIFYPHINMQKYLKSFKNNSKNIKFYTIDNDIQEVLKKSSLLITDYSSVYMDFAYMKKPIIYYQFDIDEYRKRQYSEGYFNYEKDGFGPVFDNSESLVKFIVNGKYKRLSRKYANRVSNFFELYDDDNSYRIYKLLNK